MKITIEQLEGLEACTDCIAWVKEQKDRSLAALVKEAVKNPVYKTEEGKEYDTLEFCNWGITRLMTRRQAVLYACFAARQVLGIYEDKYPDDDRPRKAIEAAEAYAKDPSEVNRQAAAASLTRAATAAGVATEAAWAATASAAASEAAWVAWAAVASRAVATESAARAATAAEAAARMAARTASEAAEAAADKNRMQAKILRYGVGLLMGQKCGN